VGVSSGWEEVFGGDSSEEEDRPEAVPVPRAPPVTRPSVRASSRSQQPASTRRFDDSCGSRRPSPPVTRPSAACADHLQPGVQTVRKLPSTVVQPERSPPGVRQSTVLPSPWQVNSLGRVWRTLLATSQGAI